MKSKENETSSSMEQEVFVKSMEHETFSYSSKESLSYGEDGKI